MNRVRSPQWALWQWFEIPDRSNPDVIYLRRLRIIDTPWFGLYLHWIYLPDTDRHPHDHPWKFTSVILKGSYTERIQRNLTDSDQDATVHLRQRFSMHRMPLDWAHRIEGIEPGTVTFIVRGRRSKSWGFWTETGIVDWKDYGTTGPEPW